MTKSLWNKFFIPNIREVHRRVTEYPQLEQTKNNFITWLEEEKQTTDNLKRNNAKLTKELKNEKKSLKEMRDNLSRINKISDSNHDLNLFYFKYQEYLLQTFSKGKMKNEGARDLLLNVEDISRPFNKNQTVFTNELFLEYLKSNEPEILSKNIQIDYKYSKEFPPFGNSKIFNFITQTLFEEVFSRAKTQGVIRVFSGADVPSNGFFFAVENLYEDIDVGALNLSSKYGAMKALARYNGFVLEQCNSLYPFRGCHERKATFGEMPEGIEEKGNVASLTLRKKRNN
jgi:hypothetical protein